MIDFEAQHIDVRAGLFASKSASDDGAVSIAEYHGYPPFASIIGQPINVRAAAYSYMKTIPPFLGGVDA